MGRYRAGAGGSSKGIRRREAVLTNGRVAAENPDRSHPSPTDMESVAGAERSCPAPAQPTTEAPTPAGPGVTPLPSPHPLRMRALLLTWAQRRLPSPNEDGRPGSVPPCPRAAGRGPRELRRTARCRRGVRAGGEAGGPSRAALLCPVLRGQRGAWGGRPCCPELPLG